MPRLSNGGIECRPHDHHASGPDAAPASRIGSKEHPLPSYRSISDPLAWGKRGGVETSRCPPPFREPSHLCWGERRATEQDSMTHSNIVLCERFEGRPPIDSPPSADHPITGGIPLKVRRAACFRRFGSQEVAFLGGDRPTRCENTAGSGRNPHPPNGSRVRPEVRLGATRKVCAEKCEVIHMTTNEIRSRSFLPDSLGVWSVRNQDSFDECIPRR